MSDLDGLIDECEHLYGAVCLDPANWGEAALADWTESVAGVVSADRDAAREVRRVIRAATKLRSFWADPGRAAPPDHGDWRTRVDIALGPKAWRPLLELGRMSLARAPSEERFDAVRQRFREATGEHWMVGVDFETWRAEHGGRFD